MVNLSGGQASMEIGHYLKQQREKNGYTQQDVADHLFLTRQTISSWEQSKSYPDIEKLVLLSDLYHVTLDELIKGDQKMVEKLKDDTDTKRLQRRSLILNSIGYMLFGVGYIITLNENVEEFLRGIGVGLILVGFIGTLMAQRGINLFRKIKKF